MSSPLLLHSERLRRTLGQAILKLEMEQDPLYIYIYIYDTIYVYGKPVIEKNCLHHHHLVYRYCKNWTQPFLNAQVLQKISVQCV